MGSVAKNWYAQKEKCFKSWLNLKSDFVDSFGALYRINRGIQTRPKRTHETDESFEHVKLGLSKK